MYHYSIENFDGETIISSQFYEGFKGYYSKEEAIMVAEGKAKENRLVGMKIIISDEWGNIV